MIEQQEQEHSQRVEERRRRWGAVGLVGGFVVGILFFGFFPGLPHVIDWGAILVSLGVGVLVRWGVRWWVGR
ncbi:hypothetical protein AQJ30_16625 [Streptomyces longwoodensis]|uniref:Uncharacterized protein n=1 Tax=Streptomyces longwoodensis TaxID=68231 RepID=A0A101QW81_9ACTN|nr:hypothetical protein [Streptomyces longwoodensis]KUN37294.1 hypothetical protein AQJ30_16625 [Streptomyces longwoodensis]